jgi:hypothetical protein
MVSIIVSSYKSAYFDQLVASINSTIGDVPFEILKVDNPGLYSLTQAYNLGASRAKYELLCFIHEDVKVHSENWGENLVSHFNKTYNLGLIGVAGSQVKLQLPTGWGHHIREKNKLNILQLTKDGTPYKISTQGNSKIDFVKVVDGVFMVTKKAIWEEYNFDENVTGYHFYDIDFSVTVGQKYKVAVVYDILLEHFSHGNYGDEWIEAAIKYNNLTGKAHLFDKLLPNEKLFRGPYYLHLAQYKLKLKSKILYIKNLGIDLRSIPAIGAFIFPKIAFYIHGLIKGKR